MHKIKTALHVIDFNHKNLTESRSEGLYYTPSVSIRKSINAHYRFLQRSVVASSLLKIPKSGFLFASVIAKERVRFLK